MLSSTQAIDDNDEPADGPNLKNGEILSRSQSAALPDTSGNKIEMLFEITVYFIAHAKYLHHGRSKAGQGSQVWHLSELCSGNGLYNTQARNRCEE
jgi:hypothetical protein